MLKSLKITDNFYLNERIIKQKDETVVVSKPVPVNFIINIDVSGSMSWELNEIRKQLKNKLPNLIKEGDTVSIIWFSGNRDAGILKEEVEIKSLTNLKDLNDAIDRFLKPVGLTAFAKPLELTKEVISRIKKNRPNSIFSLLFLTDGYNNDCSWSEVTKQLSTLTTDLSSSTFIEYGLYADSKRLTEMAEALGGEKISASNFEDYDVIFADKISKNLTSTKKVTIDIVDNKHNFVFSVSDDNEVLVYGVNNGQILINDNIEKIYYFSELALSDNELTFTSETNKDLAKVLYSAIYVLSDRTLNNDVELIYSVLGDKYTFDLFNNSFGKQKLNQYKQYIKECVSDETKRFIEGRIEDLVLDENTYCFLDLINDLSAEGNLFYPNHQDFNYKRIGAKKVSSANKISKELAEKIAQCDNLNELQTLVQQELDSIPGELKFINNEPNKGYKLSDLVYNESRCNLSVRVKFEGYVDLPTNQFGIQRINTFIYRTFTLVKDGILNISKLPVTLTPETIAKIGLFVNLKNVTEDIITIDFSSLPIINRSMVKSISATDLAKQEWTLLKLQANKKVYDHYDKTLFPKVSKGFIDTYGKEAEEYLKSIGITDFNGFAPKTTNAESTDFYMSVLLETKVAGYSSLPKVTDVITKIEKGTALKPTELLMADAVNDYNNQITSELYLSQDTEVQKSILEKWLKKVKTDFITEKRRVMNEIAKIKFGLILSKGWFKEFSSFDENTLELELDDKKVKFTFDLKEEEVKI
jgi:Mg-chelatase subunit ChlD